MRLLKLLCVGALLCSSFSPTIAYMDDNVGFVNTEEAAAPQTDEIEQTVESSPESVVEEEVPAAAEAEAPPEETAVVEETPAAEAESIEVPPLPIPDKTPDASGILEDIASGPASRIFLDDNLRRLKREHAELTYVEGVLRRTFMNFPRMYLDTNVGATATQSVSFPTWSVHNAGWDSWVGRISGNAWGGHAWYTHIYYGDHPSYPSTWQLMGLTARTTGFAGSTEAGGIEVNHSLTRSGHTMTFTVNLRRVRSWDPNRPDEWSNITAERITLDSTVVSYDSRYPHSPPMRVNHPDDFLDGHGDGIYLGWIPITNRYVEPVVTAVPSQNNFIPLGNAINEGTTTNSEQINYRGLIDHIVVNGQVRRDFTVTRGDRDLDTLWAGTRNLSLQVHFDFAGASRTAVVEVPVNVGWQTGSTIILGLGEGEGHMPGFTAAGMTLLQGQQGPRIRHTFGQGSNQVDMHLNRNFTGRTYYDFRGVVVNGERNLNNVDAQPWSLNWSAQGQHMRSENMPRAQSFTNPPNLLFAVYHAEGKIWLSEQGQNAPNFTAGAPRWEFFRHEGAQFIPLQLHRLPEQTTVHEISGNITREELNRNVANYIDLGNNNRVRAVEFVEFPDTSAPGRQEGVVRVAEELSPGNEVTYDYTVVFNVEDLVVTAVPSQNNFIPLGNGINASSTTNTDQINYRDLIDHITVNGTELRNFTVSPGLEDLDTSWAGTRDLQLLVSFVHAGALQTALVEVPVEVGWETGNTIVFGSDQEGRSAAAMNLMRNQDGGVRLTHTAGLGNDNLALHPGFSGRTYFDFREVDVNGSRNLNDIDAIPWGTIWNADGDVLKQTDVGNTREMSTISNQVYAVYHAEGKIWLSEEGQMPNYSASSAPRWEFFRRALNQFVPLQVHRLPEQTTVHEVPFGITREELNQNVTDYIDLGTSNSVRVLEFVEFPDTSVSGRQEGVIRVAERLSVDDEVTYDYTISFNVTASLEVNAVNIPVVLGTTIDEVEARDLSPYLEVKLNGRVLSPNEYEVLFVNSTLNTLTVGIPQHRPTIRINYARGGVDPVELVLPINVEWGDSIVFGGAEVLTERTVAAFTLHHGATPRINAAYGNGNDINPVNMNFAGLPYYRFNWFDMANVSELVLTDNSGDQHIEVRGDTSKQAVMTWRRQNVNYGDVVRAWVADASRNVLWENNRFVNHGGEVYYEITTSGYRPLNINRVVTTEQEVDLNTSQSELDSRLLEFIDVSSFEHVEVINFVSYPDTSRSGQTEGVIRVAETLASGERVMYDYTVVFNVADSKTMIDVSLPKEIVFGSTDLYEGEVVSPIYNIENKGTGGLRVNVQAVDVTNNDNQLALLSSSEEDPTGTSNAVRLVMNTEARSVDLHGNTSNQILADLSPSQSAQFTIGGNYFGEYGEAIRLGLDIHYRFEMIP